MELLTIKNLELRVTEAACHWDKAYSITSECRLQAAIKTLIWARQSGRHNFESSEIDTVERAFYRWFEFQETLPADLQPWVDLIEPSPSPSPS